MSRYRRTLWMELLSLPIAAMAPAAAADEPGSPAPQAVIEAGQSGQQSFDEAAYRHDPAAYCRMVEPGRVFQSAAPGPEVPQLLPVSPTDVGIPALGSTTLRVTTVAGAPVTFVSEGGGAFPNGLSVITVQADAAGLAETTYRATEGTFAVANILAGSPLASAQVSFSVMIGER